MDSLTCDGKKQQIIEENLGFCDKTYPIENHSVKLFQEPKESPRLHLSIKLARDKLKWKQKRRRNEFQKLHKKLQRPLNSVEIDKLYKGYRKVGKCTKGRNCQCYYCELLRSASSDDSAKLSTGSSSSDTSTGSEDDGINASLISCFKCMSRETKVLPQYHPSRSNITLPQFELSSKLDESSEIKAASVAENYCNFSKTQKKKQRPFSICIKSVFSIFLSIVYLLRWIYIKVTSVFCHKFCKRRARRIHPIIHKKMSPPPTSFIVENRTVQRIEASGDAEFEDELVSINIHSLS